MTYYGTHDPGPVVDVPAEVVEQIKAEARAEMASGRGGRDELARHISPGAFDFPWNVSVFGPERQREAQEEAYAAADDLLASDWLAAHVAAACAEVEASTECRYTETELAAARVAAESELREARQTIARVEALAAEWETVAATLAPEDDWGDTIGDTIAADAMRAHAAKIRATVAGSSGQAET